jgi:Fe-S oxidoreductase/nitrate reductase gamma subunit
MSLALPAILATLPTREIFWNIQDVFKALHYQLSFLALAIFLVGVAFRFFLIMQGKPSTTVPFWQGFIILLKDAAVNLRLIRRERRSAFFHLLVLWGFIILTIGTIILTIVERSEADFFKGTFFVVYEFAMDTFGLLFLAGLIGMAWIRYVIRPKRFSKEKFKEDDGISLMILFVIGITGFIIEAIRISYYKIVQGAYAGGILSYIVPQSQYLHSALWLIHSVLALIFIAIIPYTKMFHVLMAPLNILFKYSTREGTMRNVDMEGEYIGALSYKDLTRRDLLSSLACMKCGRCHDACPAYNSGTSLSPLYVIQGIRKKCSINNFFRRGQNDELVPEVIDQEGLWSCTTCRACVEQCPVYVEPMDLLGEMRRGMVDTGEIPPMVRDVLQNIQKQGNPWGESRFKREKWAKGLEVKKPRDGEFEYLWYVGCANAYDSKCIEVSKDIVQLFNNAGIDFAILGREEDCCGNDPRRMGEEGLFQLLVEKNMKTFEKYGIEKIIATSPHCYNTLKNEYPLKGRDYDVYHITEILHQLIKDGKIRPKKKIEKKVTYHDPCFLGRYNGIYDIPREIIQSIPGVELVEMERNRERSFCCGGGGGNLWVEYPGEMRPSEIRIREAADTGAEILVVSCPFCYIMLEDAVKTQKLDDVIEVVDVVELIMQSLEG